MAPEGRPQARLCGRLAYRQTLGKDFQQRGYTWRFERA